MPRSTASLRLVLCCLVMLGLAWPRESLAWGGKGNASEPEEFELTPFGQATASDADLQTGDPNQVRINSLVKVAINLDQLCEAGADALLGKDENDQDLKIAAGEWTATCADHCGDNAKIDVCAFQDPALARAAVAVAMPDIRLVLGQLGTIRKKADALASDGRGRTPLGASLASFARELDSLRMEADAGVPGATLASNVGMDVLARVLGGLAKVIEDRAKREAIGWMLDEVGEQLCGPPPSTDALATTIHHELRAHWLGNICALATEDRLDHYGAGAALLEAVRGALEADIRGWPGVLAGLALAEAHWKVVEPGADAAIVTCSSTPSDVNKQTVCGEVERLRRAGERFGARLLGRSDPLDSLRELGSAISRETIRKTGSNNRVVDTPLALLACGISLPAELAYFRPRFAIHSNPEYSALLAGLVRAPACWALVGQGHSRIGHYGTATKAIDDPNVERLSTLIRLHNTTARALQGIVVEVAAVQRAIEALEESNRAKHESSEGRVIAHWQAGVALIDASLSLADSVLVAAEGLADPTHMLPGLGSNKPSTTASLESSGGAPPTETIEALSESIEAARRVTAELRAAIEIVSQIATGEFGQALALGSSELLDKLGGACKTDECRTRVNLVVRSSGTIAALLSAETADQVAEALDAAANPPGGWRRKLAKGNFSVSLVAYPGAMGGAEFRWGPYGAHYEQGAAHAQYPTLAFPFGLDLVWGHGKWAQGMFVSMIDPVAFLQYDASNDGRLPGPRPVTVLAPGLSWRVNLGPTPLIAILGATFRPQFRTWEATVSGPGANVLQIGVALGVDVTMWKLFARGK